MMKTQSTFTPPQQFDWNFWVSRWDRMQEGYLVQRDERFETMIRLLNFESKPWVAGKAEKRGTR
jgi:hypothetical protein